MTVQVYVFCLFADKFVVCKLLTSVPRIDILTDWYLYIDFRVKI